MNVSQLPPVEIAIRTLNDDERRRVFAWFGHLRNWEKDSQVRKNSHRLNGADDVYVLKTSDDMMIFFRLEGDHITILDIAKRSTILSSGIVE